MRVRAALAALLLLATGYAVTVTDDAEAIVPVDQVVLPTADPLPPHRTLLPPMDAAHVDPPKPKPKPVVRASTPKPKPKPTVHHVTPPRSTDKGWAAGDWGRFPARVQTTALCIAHHESWTMHNGRRLWTALNLAGSTASGFAQWINDSWRTQAQRARVGTQYARAYLAPPRVQAAVFAYQMLHHGLYPWKGTHCGSGT